MKSKIIVLLFVFVTAVAQKKTANKSANNNAGGYEVVINTENISNETLQLSFVYGTNKKSFVADSIVIKNTNQKVVFKESKKIVGAIYR
jgi:hypothetical protein